VGAAAAVTNAIMQEMRTHAVSCLIVVQHSPTTSQYGGGVTEYVNARAQGMLSIKWT
jgi:hypothetical protein